MHDSLHVLAALTHDMLEASDCETRLQLVIDFALRLSPTANQASVQLAENDNFQLATCANVKKRSSAEGPRRRINRPLAWTAEKPRAAWEAKRVRKKTRVGSLVSVPICARGTTLGVLSLSSEACNAFNDQDQALAKLLAHAAAQALITSELEQRVITDAQTLAFNRGHLFPRLSQEMALARVRETPLSLLLMDLDHFKRVNDVHGHPTGDSLLAAFADRVRKVVRSTDLLVRRGGEEFVLIMPNTHEIHAVAVAERLRTKVSALPFHLHRKVRIAATVSIGVATWNGHESGEELDARADRAMYEAKQLGRNQVVRCAPTLRELGRCGNGE